MDPGKMSSIILVNPVLNNIDVFLYCNYICFTKGTLYIKTYKMILLYVLEIGFKINYTAILIVREIYIYLKVYYVFP